MAYAGAPGGTMLVADPQKPAKTANAGAPRLTSRERIDECSAMIERLIVETGKPVMSDALWLGMIAPTRPSF
jgi:hypothetical protein